MQVKTQAIDLRVERTLSHREVAPGVSAYKLQDVFSGKDEVPAWCQNLLDGKVKQGLVKTGELQKFANGKVQELKNDARYYLVPKEYLTLAQQQGFTAAEDDKELLKLLSEVNANPMEAPEDWAVVAMDYGSHMLFDVQGNPLPVGLFYDYSSGLARDGAYFMDKLVPYLQSHPQVHPYRGKHIQCESVPYYNVSPGCSKFATFVFAPTFDQMQAMWACAKKLNPKYPSTVLHEAVFELDLLGLRAAGIARSESYYGVPEEESPEED